jgi:ubiquinol-cytochrome c reductase iron-sulfur subunit
VTACRARCGGPVDGAGQGIRRGLSTLATESNMAHSDQPDAGRRDFLYIASGAVGVVGVAAVVWPAITSMNPDASVLALSSIEVDVGSIQTGSAITVKWRGAPVFIRNRTQKEIDDARAVPMDQLKDPQTDQDRVMKGHDNWLVMVGVCTHLGCIPKGEAGDYGGWLCPCHGSQYDTSGRIRKGPAPKNLVVPPYKFLSDTKVQIG